MEQAFFAKYASEDDTVAHVVFAETALEAARGFYNTHPSNAQRHLPIYIRWYEKGDERQELFSIGRGKKGIVQVS